MNHSPYAVVLDACVLYPSILRDVLLRLGLTKSGAGFESSECATSQFQTPSNGRHGLSGLAITARFTDDS